MIAEAHSVRTEWARADGGRAASGLQSGISAPRKMRVAFVFHNPKEEMFGEQGVDNDPLHS